MTSSFILKSYHLLAFTATLFIALPLTTNTKPPKLIATKLIHRDSIFSPSYNPKDSTEDRAKRMLKHSKARFEYLQEKSKRRIRSVDYGDDYNSADDDAYEANLLANNIIFLVNFSIGQPPISQYAVMDTASDLTWIQCEPCEECYKQKGPVYNSSSSSTYIDLSCSDSACISATCADHHVNDCIYEMTYLDNTTSTGTIAKEQFIFETPDDGIIVMDDVTFGCGQKNRGHTSQIQMDSGVFALGADSYIVNTLGYEFSYCIGNSNDPFYPFHRLTIGNKLKTEGYSTPLQISWDGHYYINLEGISIGQERLDINPEVFRRLDFGRFRSSVIIDSGATLTYLPQEAYDIVRDKVSSLVSGFLSRYWHGNDDEHEILCYIGNLNRDLKGFPDATFHLGGGADLVLEIESLFYQLRTDLFCLALSPTKSSSQRSVIGILAQQYYNVAYDLNQQMLYLLRIDCQLLED